MIKYTSTAQLLVNMGIARRGNGYLNLDIELEMKIGADLRDAGLKCDYHWSPATGELILDRCLGHDEAGEFYTAGNGNLDARQEEIKLFVRASLVAQVTKMPELVMAAARMIQPAYWQDEVAEAVSTPPPPPPPPARAVRTI